MACPKFYLRHLFLCVLCTAGTLTQAQDYDSVMRFSLGNIKSEFAEMTAHEQVYRLELETLRYPKRQEAYYLLAYTYSRMNSEILEGSYAETVKISELLEKVIQIDSVYSGDVVVLDVYSKVFSEWSVLALEYIVEENPDSARICFHEAYKRGGINPWLMQHYRYVLDELEPGAFVLSSGDNCSFYLIYLQFMERYRTDVIVADIGLLNTSWYYPYLLKHGVRHRKQFDSVMVDAYYTPWKDTLLNYDGMELRAWAPEGSGKIGQYERILLELVAYYGPKNRFYLTHGSNPAQNFGMSVRGCNEVLFIHFEGENAPCSAFEESETAWKALENLNVLQTRDRSYHNLTEIYVFPFLFNMYETEYDGDPKTAKQDWLRFRTVYPEANHPDFYETYKSIVTHFDDLIAH